MLLATMKIVINIYVNLDNKVYGANMGPTWVLSAPGGPHVGPMNLAIREITYHILLTQTQLLHAVPT